MCGLLTEQLFCTDCAPKGWAQYRSLQAFLRNNPGVTIIEVCRELSLPFSFVKGLISNGYLEIGETGQ